MHEGLWLLDQLLQADREASVKIRCRGKSCHIHNTYHVSGKDLYAAWRDWLFAALCRAKESGLSVEFGVNPRTGRRAKSIGHPDTQCVPLSVPVNFDVTPEYSHAERLQQVAFLSAAAFEPSVLIRSREKLYGIYLLDVRTGEAERYNLAARLAKLVRSKRWMSIVKPDAVLPMPGFTERGGSRPVKIVQPPPVGMAKLYTLAQFVDFPDAGKENYAEYYRRAQADPADSKRFLSGLLEEARRLGDRRGVLAGAMLDRMAAKHLRMRRKLGIFEEPTKNAIPPIEVLTALKYHAMTMTYVRQGREIRRETLRRFVRALLRLDLDVNLPTAEAFEAIDRRIVSQFIEMGYTLQAVTDFYWRTGYLCGKHASAEYLKSIYDKEIALLRAIPEPIAKPSLRNTPLLDCVMMVCRMLPAFTKEERKALARVDGEILMLHAKKSYRLYRAAMIANSLSPNTSAEVSGAIDACRDSYWLGSRMIEGHKMWCLSMKHLQSVGILPDTRFLTAV